MNRSLISGLALGLCLLAQPCKAEGFQVHGKVVYVDDGDTLVILRNGTEQMKTRLSSIDAPESSHTNHERGRVGQPFAERSKAFLASMVKGREVLAKCFERDTPRGRIVVVPFSQRVTRIGTTRTNAKIEKIN